MAKAPKPVKAIMVATNMCHATNVDVTFLMGDLFTTFRNLPKSEITDDGYFCRKSAEVEEEIDMKYEKQKECYFILENIGLISSKVGQNSYRYFKINTKLYEEITQAGPTFLSNLNKQTKALIKEYRKKRRGNRPNFFAAGGGSDGND